MIAPRLLSLVSLGWLRLLALTVGQLLVTASYVAQGVLIAQFLAMIFTRGPHSTGLWFLSAIVIAVALRSLVFRYIGTSGVELAADIKAAARQRLLDTILYASPGRLLIQDTGKVQTTLVDAIEKLDPYISRFLPQVWASAIGFLLICGYLIWLDPFVGGIVLSCGVLGPLVLWRALLEHLWQSVVGALSQDVFRNPGCDPWDGHAEGIQCHQAAGRETL